MSTYQVPIQDVYQRKSPICVGLDYADATSSDSEVNYDEEEDGKGEDEDLDVTKTVNTGYILILINSFDKDVRLIIGRVSTNEYRSKYLFKMTDMRLTRISYD